MKKRHDTMQVQNELEQSKFFLSARDNQDKDSHKDLSKDLSKDVSKDLNTHTKQDLHTPSHNLPSTEAVEEMVFQLRKASKVRVNGDLPEEWKQALDEYAHQSGVGKYHLVMYAVGKMLGKL